MNIMLQDDFPYPVFDPVETVGQADIVLAGGCFWCTEGVFREVPGIKAVISGYTGGAASTANYRDVCNGDTGHAEAVKIEYDPAQISLGAILRIFFWLAHDPTQENGQGNDIGSQYRSAVFYANDEQHSAAAQYIRQLDGAHIFEKPIVTRLEPLIAFYPAEIYHRNYAALHPAEAYIRGVAQPKIDKTRKALEQKKTA